MKPDEAEQRAAEPAEGNQDGDQRETIGKPRGIRCWERPERPSPYYVQWRVGGKKKTEAFAVEADRDRRAVALRKERKANSLALVPSRGEMAEWQAFRAAIGAANWRDVVAAWRQQGEPAAGFSFTVEAAVARYLKTQEAKRLRGELAADTWRHCAPKARKLAADFGGIRAAELRGEQIEHWIDAFGFEAPGTFNDYRKAVHAIFELCRREVPLNPAKDIKRRRDVAPDEVGLLTVAQTAELFRHAQARFPLIVPLLALEAFLGLRFSSAQRIRKSHINFRRKKILLPASRIKTGLQTGRSHVLTGEAVPANLWAWLRLAKEDTWTITPRQYLEWKSKAFSAHYLGERDVPHPHNCLRHGAASYHLAAYNRPGLTATMLCHTSEKLLWSTYRFTVEHGQLDGRAYYRLRPE